MSCGEGWNVPLFLSGQARGSPCAWGELWGTAGAVAVIRAAQAFSEEFWNCLGLQSEQAATGTFRNSFG